jgi:hypothetical protein
LPQAANADGDPAEDESCKEISETVGRCNKRALPGIRPKRN